MNAEIKKALEELYQGLGWKLLDIQHETMMDFDNVQLTIERDIYEDTEYIISEGLIIEIHIKGDNPIDAVAAAKKANAYFEIS